MILPARQKLDYHIKKRRKGDRYENKEKNQNNAPCCPQRNASCVAYNSWDGNGKYGRPTHDETSDGQTTDWKVANCSTSCKALSGDEGKRDGIGGVHAVTKEVEEGEEGKEDVATLVEPRIVR